MTQPLNKAMQLLQLIKEGNATKDSLMVGIDVNAAGLASQLSYLNTRGLNIAEVDPTKAEFPMKGEDGVYYMGTMEEYEAKRAGGSGLGRKALTEEEVVERAQKREDKASAAYTKAQEKLEQTPDNHIAALKAQIAENTLALASAMLSAVQQGDYQYENVTIKASE